MLRESSKAKGESYDLNLLMGAAGDGQIPHGALLVAFAEAVLGTDEGRLATTRADIRQSMGDAALVDASAVAATFNAIDRVADATGIPLEPEKAVASADFRADLDLDRFAVAGRD